MSEDDSGSMKDSDISSNESECEQPHVDYPSHHPLFDNISNEKLDPDQSSVHQLNDDCMHLVLSYLDIVEMMRVATVCRRWYNLCLNKMIRVTSLELNPTFSIFRLNRSLSQSNFIALLVLTRNNLTHLDISHSSLSLDYSSCKAIAELCPNLEELNLSKIKISRKISSHLSKYLPPKLTSLTLNGCVSMKEKCLKHIIMNTKQLERIDLSYNHKISGACIAKHMGGNKMTHMNFTECYGLKPLVVQFVMSNYDSTIQYLDLSMCSSEVFDISTASLPVLKNMRVFKAKASDNHQTPCKNMSNFLRLMPNLEVLDLQNNRNVGSDNFISSIPQLCPHLRSLNLAGCMPACTLSLSVLPNLLQLETLYLDGLSDKINYETLTKSTLVKCEKLEMLSLQSCFIDDDNVVTLISSLDNLKTLDLRSCLLSLNGSFILDCGNITRTNPIKIFAQDTVLQEEDYPIVPVFLNINFGIQCYNDGDDFFGYYGDMDDLDLYDDLDVVEEYDDGEFWDGGYVDEAAQFEGIPFNHEYNNEFHEDAGDGNDDGHIW